jgi:transcriptional regulator with XRE-family HTH domain
MSDASLSGPPQRLALELKELIAARGLKQKALAGQVGLTESSLSLILNAKARPRQLTLTRLLNRLNCTPEEQQRVLAAYDHAENSDLPLRPGLREEPVPDDEMERVRRYLEVKAKSVVFEKEVEIVLTDAGIHFEHPHSRNSIICDFYIPGAPGIVVECKYNINRDLDRTVATAKLLREEMGCDEVVVVVPDNMVPEAKSAEEEASSIKFTSLSGLVDCLNVIRKRGGEQ